MEIERVAINRDMELSNLSINHNWELSNFLISQPPISLPQYIRNQTYMNLTKPEKAGFSSERLTRIGAHMQRYIDEGKISCASTLIARRDHVVHAQCQGRANIEANQPVTPETIFRIYSMTKPIVSVALLMLYEEGHFQLNDPVSSLLPAFKNTKVCARPSWYEMELTDQSPEMTIQDLMRHTAGLSYGFYQDSPIDEMYRQARILGNDTLADMIDRVAEIPLYYQPGTGWRYSVATDVVGRLVEVVSGQLLNEFLQQRIFEPLGMTDTGFWVPEGRVDHFVAMYEAIGATTGVGVGAAASDDATETATPHLKLVDPNDQSRFVSNRTMFSGGGGLVSTMTDYLQFAKMLLNRGEPRSIVWSRLWAGCHGFDGRGAICRAWVGWHLWLVGHGQYRFLDRSSRRGNRHFYDAATAKQPLSNQARV